MKREIIFRGKEIETGEWKYGSLLTYPSGDTVIVDFDDDGNELSYDVDPDTTDQFTGLCDKNGKMVYEGDVLRLTIPDGSIRYFSVEWAEEKRTLMPLHGFEHDGNPVRISGWCFNWNGHRLYPSVIDGVSDNERMEIVGNIHENKFNEN